MNDAVGDLLVTVAKIAIKLTEPVWMDKNGEECDELNSVGLKCTIKITHPELGITVDEVGSNTSMMKDGHIGGRKYICAKGQVCQEKASKKDKRFTVLGLTCFSGDPLMCVIIIDAKTRDLFARLGVDPNAEEDQTVVLTDDDGLDLLINNIGPGKQFPGGPICQYKGKKSSVWLDLMMVEE
jgi:hypothetical protein